MSTIMSAYQKLSLMICACFLCQQAVLGDCPLGYETNGDWCYALLNVQASWAESQNYCEALGGSLAVIESQAEEQFIDGMLSRLHDTIKVSMLWIGGTDLLQEGSFVEPNTMEPLSYFNWAAGEPDNLNGQHCLGIFTNSLKWDDNNCELKFNPLCKRPRSEQEIIG